MGKSTISMAIFNSKLLVYQRVPLLKVAIILMATWHSYFSSRGRNRAGLIWTWWVFGKPRGEFLAMDGNGQYANI